MGLGAQSMNSVCRPRGEAWGRVADGLLFVSPRGQARGLPGGSSPRMEMLTYCFVCPGSTLTLLSGGTALSRTPSVLGGGVALVLKDLIPRSQLIGGDLISVGPIRVPPLWNGGSRSACCEDLRI